MLLVFTWIHPMSTGLVKAGHYNRRRRREFLHIMNQVTRDHPRKVIHVILDNLNTYKPKRNLWSKRHPNGHFYFTPTGASRLNQVEVCFRILSRSALKQAGFVSPQQVREGISRFFEVHNEKAAPFQRRKASVGPKNLKRRNSDLCN
jgi:transposase